MDDNKKFWDKWAGRYDRTMNGSREIYDKIADQAGNRLNRNMTVLELACGTGILSEKIAGFVKQLEATDFSKEMIRQAKMKNHSSRIRFSTQNALNLPYAPGSFDAVVISNALHIMPEPEKVLQNIHRVLKEDGFLIAPTFTAADSFFGRMKLRVMELSGFRVFHRWSPESYLAFLRQNGFEVVHSEIFHGMMKLTYAEARKEKK